MALDRIRVGVVVASDRASRGEYEDQGAPGVRAELNRILANEWDEVLRVIPDDREQIEKTLIELCDDEGCCLVVTTGGTGPAPRDVTPEATAAACEKILDGFGERMRQKSLEIVPTAILSRQIAGIRGASLIVNLPGKPSAIHDCLSVVFPAIPYCIDLIGGPYLVGRSGETEVFRPKKAVQPERER